MSRSDGGGVKKRKRLGGMGEGKGVPNTLGHLPNKLFRVAALVVEAICWVVMK